MNKRSIKDEFSGNIRTNFSDLEVVPSNAVRTVDRHNKIYLIVNPKLVLKQNMFNTDGYLDLITQYEKQGWKYHSIVSGNLYFYKKKGLFRRFKEWLK